MTLDDLDISCGNCFVFLQALSCRGFLLIFGFLRAPWLSSAFAAGAYKRRCQLTKTTSSFLQLTRGVLCLLSQIT